MLMDAAEHAAEAWEAAVSVRKPFAATIALDT
jgi:hypothetical protein